MKKLTTPVYILIFCLTGSVPLLAQRKSGSFKAPAVYTLNAPAAVNSTLYISHGHSKTTHPADTVKIHVEDSLNTTDTLAAYKRDTLFQARLDHRLDSIQLQLTGIKTVIRNQVYEARYQYLQYEQDSLKQLKKMLRLQKIISKEDNLKTRIYDLQIDSLHNEMRQLQRRAETGFDPADTSWMHPADYHYSYVPPVEKMYSTDSNAMQGNFITGSDTLTDQQIASLAAITSGSKNDARYARDSLYRNTIDSLNKKLYEYQLAQTSELNSQRLNDSLHYLQERWKQTDSANTRRRTVTDSSLNNSLRVMQADLHRNNDSLLALQRTLKQNQDSAAYYKQLAISTQAANENAAANRKWYQRVIPGNKKKEAKEADAETKRATDQQTYYNDRLSRLTDQVNTLQERNNTLNDNYNRIRRQRDERISVHLPEYTPTVTDSRYDRRDMNELRREINALRNQVAAQQLVETASLNRTSIGKRTVADTVYVKVPPQLPSPAPAATSTPTPNELQLQQEINRLKREMEALKPVAQEQKTVNPLAAPREATVYFGLGSSTLPVAQKHKLEVLAKNARETANTFILTGYTDAAGNAQKNMALARKRVLYVQHLLVTQYDIPLEKLLIADAVTAEKSNGKNALDRKVVIRSK